MILKIFLSQIRNTLSDSKFQSQFKQSDRVTVENAIQQATEWIDNNPNAKLEEYQEKKNELEQLWKPIITNIYQNDHGDGANQMPDMNDTSGSRGPDIDQVD